MKHAVQNDQKDVSGEEYLLTGRLLAYDGEFDYVKVADVREMNRMAFEMESGLKIIGGNNVGMM